MTDQKPSNQNLLWISIAGIAVVLALLYVAMGPSNTPAPSGAPAVVPEAASPQTATPMSAEPPPAPAVADPGPSPSAAPAQAPPQ